MELSRDWVELLEVIVPYTAVAFIVLIASSRMKGFLSNQILGGLLFTAMEKPGDVVVPPDAATSKKQLKKLQQQVKASRSANPSIAWYAVGPSRLNELSFSEDFDYLLIGCMVCLVSTVVEMLMKVFVTPKMSTNYFSIMGAGLFFIWGFLVKVEWLHSIITKQDKLYMLIAGTAGAVLACSMLTYLPSNLLAFDTAAATTELLGRLQSMMNSKKTATLLDKMSLEAPKLQPVEASSGVVLAAVLAGMAGAMSALFMNPGLRFGRVFVTLLKPPMWSRHFVGAATPLKLAAQCAVFMQVMIIPLWVPSLTEALFIPPDMLPYLRGVALLLVAVLHGIGLQSMIQAFLFTAPFHADVIDNTPDVDANTRTELLRQQCRVTLSQLCKAGIQLVILPSMLTICACLHILMSFVSPKAGTHPNANDWDMKPSVLFQTVVGFLGWWGSTAYISWAGLGVLMARLKGIE